MSGDPNKCNQTLSARQQARLAAILARLASPFDGERAAAALLATAFLTRHNLGWADLTGGLPPVSKLQSDPIEPPAKLDRRRPGNKLWRGYCRRRSIGRGNALDVAA